MRMTVENWKRFKTQGKKTTIRTRIIPIGIHKVLAGPLFKSTRLGRLFIGSMSPFKDVKKAKDLTEQDARNDGFRNLCELLIELAHRNPNLTVNTTVYIHPARVIEDLIGA